MKPTDGRITAFQADVDDFVAEFFAGSRKWLDALVEDFVADDKRRHLVIIGEPGVGKSAYMAHLAAKHDCPRYFTRAKDELELGVAGTDPKAFLVSVGRQLGEKYGPEVFGGGVTVRGEAEAGKLEDRARAVGADIDELHASPFRRLVVEGSAKVGEASDQARVQGVHIKRLIDSSLTMDARTLLHDALIEPLAEIARIHPGEKVVLLVDGLDVALSQTGMRIVDLIPKVDNLKVVMTSRPGTHLVRFPTDEKVALSEVRDVGAGAEGASYAEQNRDDVRKYLAHVLESDPDLAPAVAARASPGAYVERVAQRSEGNFLYARHFLVALRHDVEAERFDLLEPDGVPEGLDGIYRAMLMERIKQDLPETRWEKVYIPVLGVLAVAREFLTRAQVARYSGVAGASVDSVVGRTEQFLDIERGEEEDFYRVYHTSFAEYLLDRKRNRDYPLDGPAHHYEIASRVRGSAGCWADVDWEGLEDRYAYRHLAAHLTGAGKPAELFELVRDAEFPTIQARALPDDPSLPARTFGIAVQAACDADNAARMGEFLLLGARWVSSVSAESPLAALRSGGLKRAWERADFRHESDAAAVWYLLLAWELKDAGRSGEAADTLKRLADKMPLPRLKILSMFAIPVFPYLLGIDDGIWDGLQEQLLDSHDRSDVCKHLAQCGELEKAREVVQAASDDWVTAPFLTVEACEHARRGESGEVQRCVAGLQEFESKLATPRMEEALAASALEQTRLGRFDDAALTARVISAPQTRGRVLGEIAVAQSRAGQQDAADAIIEEMLASLGDRPELEWWLAPAMLLAGHASRAREAMERAGDEGAPAGFAAALARSGDLETALAQVAKIEDERARAGALGGICDALAREGDFEDARGMIRRIENRAVQEDALYGLCNKAVTAGDFEAARRAAREMMPMSLDMTREQAFADIAAALARGGQSDEARAVLTETLSAVLESFHRHIDPDAVSRGLSAAWARKGDLVAALEAARRVGEDVSRAYALANLAPRFAAKEQAGMADELYAEALEIAKGTGKFAPQIQGDVAVIQTEAGNLSAALKLAQRIEHAWYRSGTSRKIAVIQAGQVSVEAARETFRDAAEWACKLEQEGRPASELREIAEAQTRVRDDTGAFETSGRIQDEVERGKTLLSMTRIRAELGDGEGAREMFDVAWYLLEALEQRWWATMHEGKRLPPLKDMHALKDSLPGFCEVLAKVGDLEKAKSTAARIDRPERKAKALHAIAVQEHESNPRAARALFTIAVELCAGDYSADELLGEIAASQTALGEFDAARATADRIADEERRCQALGGCAVALCGADRREEARNTFAAATAIAESLDDSDRDGALGKLAVQQAEAGLGNQAVQTSRLLAQYHETHLTRIATELVKGGDRTCFKEILKAGASYPKAASPLFRCLLDAYPDQVHGLAEVAAALT